MHTPLPERMDRRLAIKWMLAAGAGAMLADPFYLAASEAAGTPAPPAVPARGYGIDPDLVKPYTPGDYWPLTFTDAERRTSTVLSDVIIPAEGGWPAASSVGVPDFLDEWVSAPYPSSVADRKTITEGLAWIEAESSRRFGKGLSDASGDQRASLCMDLSAEAPANSPLEAGSKFFKRLRNLVAVGYYTTPVGMKDLGYVGNVPLARFEGPPADLVAKLGLTDEVAW